MVRDIEYTVLSALIENSFISKKIKQIVIRRDTPSIRRYLPDTGFRSYMKSQIKKMELTTLADLMVANEHCVQLQPWFTLSVPYILLPDDEQERIFRAANGDWNNFYLEFPDSPGLLTVSRVGFNPDVTQALAYAAQSVHGRMGRGALYLLHKPRDRWKIQQTSTLWIS